MEINVPFCFPVVFHGLLCSASKYTSASVFNIIMDGNANPYGPKDPTPRGKVIFGKEPMTPKWVNEYFENDTHERRRRIESLEIQYPRQVVSAFHTYLHSDDCEVQIRDYELKKLDRVLFESNDPYDYIQTALEMTLSPYPISWVNIRTQIIVLKEKLLRLPEIIQTDDLYAASDDEYLLSTGHSLNIEALATTWMPWVVKAFFSALFPNAEINSEYIQSGDIRGFIGALLKKNQLSHWEYYKWMERRLPIADLAYIILQSEKEKHEELDNKSTIDLDWLISFFEKAGEVSNEDMRRLWAKVLAGEIRKPGTFSEKSIRVLLDLDATAAYCFEHVSRFLIKNTAQPREPQFIIDTSWMHKGINSNFGICTEDLNLLTSYGILSSRMSSEFTFMAVKEPGQWDEVLSNRDERIVIKMKIKTPEDCRRFSYVKYELTPVGKELLTIMPEPDEDYLPMLGACLAAEIGEGYEVGVYRVTKTQISHGDFTVKAGSGMITLYRLMAEEEEYLDLEHNLLTDLPFEEKLREAFHRYNEQAEDVEE